MFDGTKPGPGRPKGAKNKATIEAKGFYQRFLESKEYRESAKRRILDGSAPHLETMAHHYAYGKPVDKVEHTGEDGGPITLKWVE
jgi:hypothetical protein